MGQICSHFTDFAHLMYVFAIKEIKMENKQLEMLANEIRKDILTETYHAKSGHPGGSLSAADIITSLFFEEMDINKDNINTKKRDRFVLSKGHASPALYAVYAQKGFIDKELLPTFRHLGSCLQGHPSMLALPCVDMSTGSLGQGVSTAVGMALANKLDNSDYRVYALCGDGECQEGQVWEATMSAAHFGLDNLCIIIDNNDLQIDGYVHDVMSVYPLDEKFKAFNCNVINIDGHNFDQLREAFAAARNFKGKPTVIIAKTIKGKGVSFMEDVCNWHGVAPKEDEYLAAIAELEAK